MTTILVTGGNGQLASCIKDVAKLYHDLKFIYTSHQDLDICNLNQVEVFFKSNKINYCVNCAAYTAVDKAEEDVEKAFKINGIGVKNLAESCKKRGVTLIHISTDFVFDGTKGRPYLETDETKPLSVYGKSKLKGEIEIQQILNKYFIIRTSWLYSEYGNNFVKTMLSLSETHKDVSVVKDQIGSPTYAGDLAKVIIHLINSKITLYGIYNYSNLGEISWHDFAKAIFKLVKSNIILHAINTDDYPTLAKRPEYSVLDKTKIIKMLNTPIPYWDKQLEAVVCKFF